MVLRYFYASSFRFIFRLVVFNFVYWFFILVLFWFFVCVCVCVCVCVYVTDSFSVDRLINLFIILF